MNIHEFKTAQAKLIDSIDDVIKSRVDLHKLRIQVIKRFSYDFIENGMTIDDYVIGKPIIQDNLSFCYIMERQLDGLGRIIGANAFKFGVYYGKTKDDQTHKYRVRQRWGESPKKAFKNIKGELLNLLEAGAAEDHEALVQNQLSHMFKGKILSVYYPNKYLNVFSEAHLDYFLRKLGLFTKELSKADPIYKRLALQNFKDNDEYMKDWSYDIFSYFLYNEYPKGPSKSDLIKVNIPKELEEYLEPQFPNKQYCSILECEIDEYPEVERKRRGKKTPKKLDYNKDARYKRKLGEQGEYLVMELEKEFLKKNNLSHLISDVKQMSLTDDSLGYDIRSFDIDGNPKHIEVKATKDSENVLHFYLTANEMEKSKSLENYFIYIVTEIMSENPKVRIMSNPIKNHIEKLKITPINYHISLKFI